MSFEENETRNESESTELIPAVSFEEVNEEAADEVVAEINGEDGFEEKAEKVKNETVEEDKKDSSKKDKPKKNKRLFVMIIAGIILVACLVLAGIIAFPRIFGGKDKVTGAFSTWYSTNENISYIVYNGEILSDTLHGCAVAEQSSSNGTQELLTCGDSLYIADSKLNLRLVTEEYDYFSFCFDGSTVVFTDTDHDLYLFNTKNAGIRKIASGVDGSPVISPSGKSVAYNVDEDGDKFLYVYTGKKAYKLARDVEPVALTDNAKYIYYYDSGKQAIYVTDKKYNSNKLATNTASSFVFNRDCTQIVFCSDSDMYLSENGGEKVLLKEKSHLDFYPLKVFANDAFMTLRENQSWIGLSNVKDFRACYCLFLEDIVYIDDSLNCEKVVNNYIDFDIDKKLKYVYYTTDDLALYAKKLGTDTTAVKLADDVFRIVAAPNGKKVYFTNSEGTLFSCTPKGKTKKIADDVYVFNVTYDNKLLYMSNDSDDGTYFLYSVGAFGKKELISDKAVESIFCYPHSTMFKDNLNNETFDVHIAGKGTDFNTVLNNVQ